MGRRSGRRRKHTRGRRDDPSRPRSKNNKSSRGLAGHSGPRNSRDRSSSNSSTSRSSSRSSSRGSSSSSGESVEEHSAERGDAKRGHSRETKHATRRRSGRRAVHPHLAETQWTESPVYRPVLAVPPYPLLHTPVPSLPIGKLRRCDPQPHCTFFRLPLALLCDVFTWLWNDDHARLQRVARLLWWASLDRCAKFTGLHMRAAWFADQLPVHLRPGPGAGSAKTVDALLNATRANPVIANPMALRLPIRVWHAQPTRLTATPLMLRMLALLVHHRHSMTTCLRQITLRGVCSQEWVGTLVCRESLVDDAHPTYRAEYDLRVLGLDGLKALGTPPLLGQLEALDFGLDCPREIYQEDDRVPCSSADWAREAPRLARLDVGWHIAVNWVPGTVTQLGCALYHGVPIDTGDPNEAFQCDLRHLEGLRTLHLRVHCWDDLRNAEAKRRLCWPPALTALCVSCRTAKASAIPLETLARVPGLRVLVLDDATSQLSGVESTPWDPVPIPTPADPSTPGEPTLTLHLDGVGLAELAGSLDQWSGADQWFRRVRALRVRQRPVDTPTLHRDGPRAERVFRRMPDLSVTELCCLRGDPSLRHTLCQCVCASR